MRYPLSIHDFGRIRRGGYAYVDKTEAMIKCLDAGAALLLSRPRRFGKSLMISTYREMYSGSRELFEGLYAGEHWGFEERQRPVIHVDFAGAAMRTTPSERIVNGVLDREAKRHGVTLPAHAAADAPERF